MMEPPKQTRGMPPCLRRSPCCIATSILLALLVILALIASISAAVIGKIKTPSVDSKDTTLESFKLDFTPTPKISLTLGILLEVGNPNNVGLRFDQIIMNITYLSSVVGQANVNPFTLGVKKTKLVNSTFQVDRYNLLQAAPLLLGTVIVGPPIRFNITGWTKASARILGVRTSKRNVHFQCDATFNYSSKEKISTSCKSL